MEALASLALFWSHLLLLGGLGGLAFLLGLGKAR